MPKVDMWKLVQVFNPIARVESVGDDWVRFEEAVDIGSFLFWVSMQDQVEWLDVYVFEVEGVNLFPIFREDEITGLRIINKSC